MQPAAEEESPEAAQERLAEQATRDFYLMVKRMCSGKGLPDVDIKMLLNHLRCCC
jgi:hypothetical protein